MARLEGLEPPAGCLEGSCSIRLSYRRMMQLWPAEVVYWKRSVPGGHNGRERRRDERALLAAGTTSAAGKSVITAGQCRWLRRPGVRVAPFTAQNMLLNSFVTHDGAGS